MSTGGFVSAKAPALLAYLAVTGRPHSRDTLAALLWGEMAGADAKNNLRQTLSNLRKTLEPYLLITRDAVQFNTAVPHTLDVAQFENQLRRARDAAPSARIAAMQQAVALYQGDFLAGFYVRDAPEFEEWMLAQRARYRELALHALHIVTEYHLERGEYGRAIDGGTRLLSLDPWREAAYRQLMQALAHSGQRMAALAQYETCRRVLDKELGVPPSAETTALYQRIKAAGDVPRHNLPPQPTPFVGRAAELAEISALLLRPERRLIILLGAGGIGKTRLALQAAMQTARRGLFLHGVYFVPLEGVETLTGLVTAVARAIDFSFSGSREPAAQLLDHLREQELLLVLDNFEQLLDSALWLTTLLQQAPGLKLLLTSRERLNVQWEWCVMLDGLDFPAALPAAAIPDPPTDLSAYSAIRLFIDRARAARHDFVADEATVVPHIIRVCRLTAGMPLALELAAASVRHFSCAEIADAIAHNLDFLATGYRDIPPRQRSMRAVFDYSWALLDLAEQQLFASLSVFRGGFTLEAAAQVAGATRPLLAALSDKSLLRRDESNDRYHLHEMLRQYADQQLAETQRSPLQARHAGYFAGWLHQLEATFHTPQQTEILAALNSDQDNVRACWQWAATQADLGLLEQSLITLRNYYNVQSRFVEGREWLAQTAAVLPLPETDDARRLQAKILVRWASFCVWSGQAALAETLFAQGLALARPLADAEEIGFAMLNKGYLTVMTSADYPAAEQQFSESLACYRQAEIERGVADALSALGALYNMTGQWEQAKECLQESVTIARAIEDEHGLCSSLTNLGNIHYLTGDLAQAGIYYREVVGLCQKLGDRSAEGIVLSNLGAIAYDTADYAAAERLLQQGVTIFQEINSPQSAIQATAMLCGVYRAIGQYERARQGLQGALAQALAQRLDHLTPHILFELAQLYEATGQNEAALELFYWTSQSPAAVAEHKQDAQQGIARLEPQMTMGQITAVQQRSQTLDVHRVLAEIVVVGEVGR